MTISGLSSNSYDMWNLEFPQQETILKEPSIQTFETCYGGLYVCAMEILKNFKR